MFTWRRSRRIAHQIGIRIQHVLVNPIHLIVIINGGVRIVSVVTTRGRIITISITIRRIASAAERIRVTHATAQTRAIHRGRRGHCGGRSSR